jgi:hypothetical protein
MRVITFDGEGLVTRELHFARLPGDVIVVIFRDKKGEIHSVRTSDILEIVDA